MRGDSKAMERTRTQAQDALCRFRFKVRRDARTKRHFTNTYCITLKRPQQGGSRRHELRCRYWELSLKVVGIKRVALIHVAGPEAVHKPFHALGRRAVRE